MKNNNNNLVDKNDLMMIELNESFLEQSVFTSYDIDESDQEDIKTYIKLIALLISSKDPEELLNAIYPEPQHQAQAQALQEAQNAQARSRARARNAQARARNAQAQPANSSTPTEPVEPAITEPSNKGKGKRLRENSVNTASSSYKPTTMSVMHNGLPAWEQPKTI
jgi:hypothetical protein